MSSATSQTRVIPTRGRTGIQRYFLRATFATNRAASGSGTYAGEIGTLSINDTTSDVTITGGRATSAGGSVGNNNPGISGNTALTRQNGLMMVVDLKQVQVGTDAVKEFSPYTGWQTTLHNTTLANFIAVGWNPSIRFTLIPRAASTPEIYIPITGNPDRRFWSLCSGSLVYIGVNNNVAGVVEGIADASLYPFVGDIGANRYSFDIAYMAAGLLRGQYAQDNALRTLAIASVSNGQTFTHPANFWMWVTITTVPSSGNLDIVFRQQDINNKWILRVSSTGVLSVIEVVAGAETPRSSSAGGYVTNGTRLMMLVDDVNIVPYKAYVVGTLYLSASNFKTATSGVVTLGTGGAVSDLHVHYRDVPAGLQAAINAS